MTPDDIFNTARKIFEGSELLESFNFGQFNVIRKLGQGSFAEVYLATEAETNRLCTLKVLTRTAQSEIDAFIKESTILKQLDHTNIVKILDHGEIDGRFYIAMEYVDGLSLDKLTLQKQQAVQVTIQIAEALEHAHSKGILHRDIKPQNIILDRALVPHIVDFGLAHSSSDTAHTFSQSGIIIGTPGYAPPEQIKGLSKEMGPTSDIFSLGALLYYLLTDKQPFSGKSVIEVLQGSLSRQIEFPSGFDPSLRAIVENATEKAKKERYQSMQSFVKDLKIYLSGKKIKRPLVKRAKKLLIPATLFLLFCLSYIYFSKLVRNEPDWILSYESMFDSLNDWKVLRGKADIHNGELCLREGHVVLAFDLANDLKMSFEAKVMEDSLETKEISCFICGSPFEGLKEGYSFEFGIGDNTYNTMQRARIPTVKSTSPLIQKGKTYKISVSKLGNTLSFDIDGKNILEYRDEIPLKGLRIGFGSQCQHIHYDNLQVHLLTKDSISFAENLKSHDFQNALFVFRELYKKEIPDHKYRIALGYSECLLKRGQLSEAISISNELLKAPPETIKSEALRLLVEAHIFRNDYEIAQELIDKWSNSFTLEETKATLNMTRSNMYSSFEMNVSIEDQKTLLQKRLGSVSGPDKTECLARLVTICAILQDENAVKKYVDELNTFHAKKELAEFFLIYNRPDEALTIIEELANTSTDQALQTQLTKSRAHAYVLKNDKIKAISALKVYVDKLKTQRPFESIEGLLDACALGFAAGDRPYAQEIYNIVIAMSQQSPDTNDEFILKTALFVSNRLEPDKYIPDKYPFRWREANLYAGLCLILSGQETKGKEFVKKYIEQKIRGRLYSVASKILD